MRRCVASWPMKPCTCAAIASRWSSGSAFRPSFTASMKNCSPTGKLIDSALNQAVRKASPPFHWRANGVSRSISRRRTISSAMAVSARQPLLQLGLQPGVGVGLEHLEQIEVGEQPLDAGPRVARLDVVDLGRHRAEVGEAFVAALGVARLDEHGQRLADAAELAAVAVLAQHLGLGL